MATLKTPIKIRELQRKLYLKAKQEKNFRFYLLYDKVYRQDILSHAYELVRANKGVCGVDGMTFKSIEEGEGGAGRYLIQIAEELKTKTYKSAPVMRVYIPKSDGGQRPLGIPTIKDRVIQMATKLIIEPIFEADFHEYSYGFRPKKNAHQAIEDITQHLRRGKTQVIDADLSKYFDSIPHDKLLKLVAKRIVDKQILKLIKMWLKAPVMEEREDGKRECKRNEKGTPQGGVVSPLLANIYLNVLDTLWKGKEIEKEMEARLVRYADDFVVLCRRSPERIYGWLKTEIEKLELSLNEAKTHVIDSKQESFNFLGFNIRMTRNKKTGKIFPFTRPAKKTMKHIRTAIKEITHRRNHNLPTGEVIGRINSVVRGWVGYYYFGNCSRDLSNLRYYLGIKVRAYLRRRHGLRSRGYKFTDEYLYNKLGLYTIPVSAPWSQAAKASGRR